MEGILSAYDCFKSVTKHPEFFLKQQNEKTEKIQRDLIEPIYKCSKSLEDRKSKALKKIVTNGMDAESIWQQLELQNGESFEWSLKEVSRFLATSSQRFQLNLDGNEVEEDELSDNDEKSEASHNSEEITRVPEASEGEEASEGSGDESDAEERPQQKRKLKKSIVDDQFFKLSEMEEFLIYQDRREMGHSKSDDDIDYFAHDNDEINLQESLKYSDFFDPVHKDDGDGDDDDGQDSESPDGYEDEGPKSSHEVRQERLKKKIQRMEEDMLEAKTWQMKGEVKADNRPQNSLLEEILEFDSTTRPAPVITEKVSVQLEDIIKQRIKDRAFDDVERKVKPSDVQYEYKKQIVLDQEKSKQSLSQIYEKEYLQEMEKNNPNATDDVEEEEPKEHKQIRAELKDLFEKLDMLSNFHYTPKAAQPELKIITNLPTISMEEVAPVSAGNATMLAPEEIKLKPRGGHVIGASERSKTDKNRDRRHKKAFQRDKFSKPSNNKESLVNKVMKSRNVEKMKTSADSAKSSSAFFSKLQDEMDVSKSNGKTAKSGGGGKRKAEKQNHQAKKLKL